MRPFTAATAAAATALASCVGARARALSIGCAATAVAAGGARRVSGSSMIAIVVRRVNAASRKPAAERLYEANTRVFCYQRARAHSR